MCVSALILSQGITFSYVGLAGVVTGGCCVGLTLPYPKWTQTSLKSETALKSCSAFMAISLWQHEND